MARSHTRPLTKTEQQLAILSCVCLFVYNFIRLYGFQNNAMQIYFSRLKLKGSRYIVKASNSNVIFFVHRSFYAHHLLQCNFLHRKNFASIPSPGRICPPFIFFRLFILAACMLIRIFKSLSCILFLVTIVEKLAC